MAKIKITKLSKKQLSKVNGGAWCPDNHHLNKAGDCEPNYNPETTRYKPQDRR